MPMWSWEVVEGAREASRDERKGARRSTPTDHSGGKQIYWRFNTKKARIFLAGLRPAIPPETARFGPFLVAL